MVENSLNHHAKVCTSFPSLIMHAHKTPAKLPHGLIPPAFNTYTHKFRCLDQFHSKDKDIEKYIYLSHLKDDDPHMFYLLVLEHMSVRSGVIITCIQARSASVGNHTPYLHSHRWRCVFTVFAYIQKAGNFGKSHK